MFTYISKIVTPLLMPLSVSALLVIFGVLYRRGRKIGNWLIWIGILVILISGNRYFANFLAYNLEKSYPPYTGDQHFDAIVVLGGSTEPAISPRTFPEVNGASDRLFLTARLWKSGKADNIILSGGAIEWLDGRDYSAAQEMRDLLLLFEIPVDKMLLQEESSNTREDALLTAKIIEEQDYESVLLVTSAWHMRRSIGVYGKLGIEVTPAPCDYLVTEADLGSLKAASLPQILINFIPSVGAMSQTALCLKEYFGYWVYQIMGWI